VLTLLSAEDTRAWGDIPGVVFVGIAMGLALVVVAIRAMFGGKK
jgi:hypothetical protein